MKDHYEEIHKLVREDYSYDFLSLQELIAEMVIKTKEYNSMNSQERYDKILYLLIGHPQKDTQHEGSTDDSDDLRRLAALCKEMGLTIGEAAAELSRQHYIENYKFGDGFPKDINHNDKARILSRARRLKLKMNENEIENHAKKHHEKLNEEWGMLTAIEKDVGFAKSLFSEWLDRYHSQ
ncbi:MAG: hypothetical protein WBK55_08580 [Alphaproteobacteria bacterium]